MSDDSDEDEVTNLKKKIRKLQNDANKTNPMEPTESNPVTLDIVSNGHILVAPEVWQKLDKTLRDFVVKYNRSIQHNDPAPDISSNVILMKGGEQVRRKCECLDESETLDSLLTKDASRDTDIVAIPIASPTSPSSSSSVDTNTKDKPKGVTFGIGQKYRLPSHITLSDPDNAHLPTMEEKGDILIFDTGGGRTPTVSSKAWRIIANTRVSSSFQGYGPGTPVTKCDVVHAVTKAHIQGRDKPILLVIHHASYVTDPEETESLLTLMDLLKNSVEVNGVTPPQYVKGSNKEKTCSITVEGEYLPFEHDDEKLFFTIEKPEPEEMDDTDLQTFELNSRDPLITGVEPVYPIVTR